jgi:hypothetical protein
MLRILLTILFFSAYASLASADFRSGGDAYKRGDYETAAKEFLPIAEKGDHRAMQALGSMYAAGHGVPQDFQASLKWFRRAAKYGRPDAMFKIGLIYDEGHGVDVNLKQALKWYGKSAKNGYGAAQFKIGMMYTEGRGIKQDLPKAYAWLSLASSKGIDEADIFLKKLEAEMTPEQLEQTKTFTQRYKAKYGNKSYP